MPRAKRSQPIPVTPAEEPRTVLTGPFGEVMTLAEAAAYLRLPEGDVLRLVDEQALPGRRLGNEWRFLKAAIRQWLSASPGKENKEAWMALAGVWKDDPDAERELRDIYERRRRTRAEDEP